MARQRHHRLVIDGREHDRTLARHRASQHRSRLICRVRTFLKLRDPAYDPMQKTLATALLLFGIAGARHARPFTLRRAPQRGAAFYIDMLHRYRLLTAISYPVDCQ